MTETLRALVERAIELLKHVNVLDCGAHHCRYCLAKSPQWEHTPSCPYAESQRLHTEAGELRRALSAALATAQAAPGWRDIASAAAVTCKSSRGQYSVRLIYRTLREAQHAHQRICEMRTGEPK